MGKNHPVSALKPKSAKVAPKGAHRPPSRVPILPTPGLPLDDATRSPEELLAGVLAGSDAPPLTDPELTGIVEALLFAAAKPMTLDELSRAVGVATPRARVREALVRLENHLVGHGGLRLAIVDGGFQLRTNPAYADYVGRLFPERPRRLSRGSMETLAIVAYRQPVIRAEVDAIRGVDSGHLLRFLLEQGLVRVAGRRDAPGRPVEYVTAPRFLELFGLAELADLPPLSEFTDLNPDMQRTLEKLLGEGQPVRAKPGTPPLKTGVESAASAASSVEQSGSGGAIEGVPSPPAGGNEDWERNGDS